MTGTEDQVGFRFDELSDEAKRVAVEWYREGQHEMWEPFYDDIVTCFGFLGIEFDQESYRTYGGQTLQRPDIEYQLSWCQGDGAVFKGRWNADGMDIAALHEHAPQDEHLHAFGRRLMLVLLKYPQSWATIVTRSVGGSGLSSMSIETFSLTPADDGDDDFDEDAQNALEEIFKGCAQWIYTQFREDLEWQGADEQCIEGIEANDYTFDEEGNHI
jgi:hypothetical protein